MTRSPGGSPSGADLDPRIMTSLYTFDCRREDGSPICLEAKELATDLRALAWAQRLLGEHVTCANIEVFDGDRLVGAVAREASPPDLANGEGLTATRSPS